MNNLLYESINDKIQCLLCPNKCLLNNNQSGKCGVRVREHDKIINKYSGILSSTAIDPVEKKPLYHFHPSKQIFSVGFYGCTLKCQFCQNYSISQSKPLYYKYTKPEEILDYLKKNRIDLIAFTYSEPTLYYEWVLETSKLCKQNNIKTVLVTNGYLNIEPAKELLKYIDAANIDLKGATNDFYKNICSGQIKPVKDFIKISYDMKVHIEITTLLITNTNDSDNDCNEIVDFISSISNDIPFHISRYHPDYNFTEPPTPLSTIERWIFIARKKLNYVYGGNVPNYGDTYCKKCKELLIQRNFYNISIKSISKDGHCLKCNEFNNIIFY